MRLRNTTEWPDYFLRRMVSWCCEQIGLPSRAVRRAAFGNRSRGSYSGHAWHSMRFHVSIGPGSAFPTKGHIYPGRTSEDYRSPAYANRLDALVGVTAHELTHLLDYHNRRNVPQIRALRRGDGEWRTMRNERRLSELFIANRDALIAEWSAPPAGRKAKPAISIQDKRAAKAQADLDRWQRKLKLAQTKVRKLRQRVRYYDGVIAAKRNA